MEIFHVTEEAFQPFGRVWSDLSCEKICKEMEHTPLPDDVVYVPSVEDMEMTEEAKLFQNRVFGGMPIQIGYCNGHNKKLNAVEYHRNSEINIAVTDMVLMLGKLTDVATDFTYETDKIVSFYVPAGTVVEMYGTTLHYAPCNTDEAGFKCVVILPKGTNTEIDFPLSNQGEDQLMTAKNKWLIAHENAGIEGAFCGLKGENLSL